MAKGIMYIDGQRVPFDGEKNVLAVIRKAGIDMPTFCYYSELSVYGACRMCVVEDERGKIETSCSMKPRDGLSIRTNTARLLRHRRMMNRPGGYWIAGFAPEAARHGTHRVYRREELSRVVLFSDGFSGQREALLGAEEPCLQELYQQLRQREAADSRCNRYPRLKPGDDVSGIVAVF